MARPIHDGKFSYLLALARNQPSVPMIFRPIFFVWWASHFLFAVWVSHYATSMIRVFDHPTGYQRAVTEVIRILFAIGVSFSANSYLILMAASLARSKAALQRVFRLRFRVDVLLIADLLIPHHMF
jgi:hypothetical protein